MVPTPEPVPPSRLAALWLLVFGTLQLAAAAVALMHWRPLWHALLMLPMPLAFGAFSLVQGFRMLRQL